MKHKWSMALLWAAAIVLTCWAVFQLLWHAGAVPFDPENVGVVDVIVVDHHGRDPAQQYYNIGMGCVKQETEAFQPEAMTVYTVDADGLESYIDRDKNKVLNRLEYICISDEQNQPVEVTPVLEALMNQAAKLEHDIMELHIFQVGGELFLQTELNVNLWCPVELYWYDAANDRLIELYTFDGLEVVGLRVRDLERAK